MGTRMVLGQNAGILTKAMDTPAAGATATGIATVAGTKMRTTDDEAGGAITITMGR